MEEIFVHNRAWARRRVEADPDFFARLSRQQAPCYMWLGCSESHMPANEITGLNPGGVSVHRNVANPASNLPHLVGPGATLMIHDIGAVASGREWR